MLSVAALDAGLAAIGSAMMPSLQQIADIINQLFPTYWGFMSRGVGTFNTGKGLADYYPAFWTNCAWSTAFFVTIYVAFLPVVRYFFPQWVKQLEPHKRNDLPGYALCLFHHVLVVPWAALHIYRDLYRTDYAAFDYATTEQNTVPLLVGYLCADLLCTALPTLSLEYILHHSITLYLTFTGCMATTGTHRWIPHLLFSDITQISFNTAWILRLTPFKEKHEMFIMGLELAFAVSFFFVRVWHMSCVFLVETLQGTAIGMGLGRFTLLPLTFLQFFWMHRIVATVRRKLAEMEKGKKAKTI